MNSLARHWIEEVLVSSPVARSLGVSVVHASPDEVRVDLPFSEELTTVPGILHGGVISTLVDIVGAMASAAGLSGDDDAVTGGATANLSVSFLAPGRGDLSATASVVHRTRTTTLSDVRVRDQNGLLVASAQVDSRLFR